MKKWKNATEILTLQDKLCKMIESAYYEGDRNEKDQRFRLYRNI